MANRIQTGIALAKSSLQIVRSNKRLLIIPFVSLVVTIIVMISILTPMINIETHAWKVMRVSSKEYLIFFGLLLLFFSAVRLIQVFSTAVITAYILMCFREPSPMLWTAIKHVMKKAVLFLRWSTLLGTWAIAIRLNEVWNENWPKKRFAHETLLNMRWLKATYFVTHIMLDQDITCMKAVTYSAKLTQDAWCKDPIPRLGLGPVTFLIYLAAFLPLLIGAYFSQDAWHITLGGAISTAILLSILTISNTMKATTLTALYLFAINNQKVSGHYGKHTLESAFFCQKAD